MAAWTPQDAPRTPPGTSRIHQIRCIQDPGRAPRPPKHTKLGVFRISGEPQDAPRDPDGRMDAPGRPQDSRLDPWHDDFILSFRLQDWLWSTGLENQPGPTLPHRRCSTKQSCPECPQPPCDNTQVMDSVRWESVIQGDREHQTPPWDLTQGFLAESKNATSLAAHEQGLANRVARLTLVQEHSMPHQELKRARQRFRKQYSRQLVAGPPDPNNHHNAGVAGIASGLDTIFEYKPITPEFAKMQASGRAIHLGYCMGKHGTLFSVFNVYGHSGGAQNARKAKATLAILEACIQEASHFPNSPKLLFGDLNGDFDSFPQLDVLCGPMGWQDLNAIADTWGQEVNQPTCRTSHSSQATIRDYVFACPLAMPMIKNFRIVDHGLCPTHSTLQVDIVPQQAEVWQHQATAKKPLADILEEAFTDRYGVGPSPPPDNLQEDLDQLMQDDTLPEQIRDPKILTQPHPYLKKLASDCLKEARAHHKKVKCSFPLRGPCKAL